MGEEFKLTLEPEAEEPKLELEATMTAAQEALAEAEAIESEAEKQRRIELAQIMMEENTLSEAERKQVEEFSKKIGVTEKHRPVFRPDSQRHQDKGLGLDRRGFVKACHRAQRL